MHISPAVHLLGHVASNIIPTEQQREVSDGCVGEMNSTFLSTRDTKMELASH